MSALYSHSLPLSSSLAALPSPANNLGTKQQMMGKRPCTRHKVLVGFIFAAGKLEGCGG